MRFRTMTLVAGAALLAPAAATAQSLADRVNAAPADATVRFTYESKPGVCGNGTNISVRRDAADGVTVSERGRQYTISSGRVSGDDWMADCVEGPVVFEITREGRSLTNARARVGVEARAGGVDLGSVTPDAAVQFLLDADVLTRAGGRAADRMIFAATLADAESWPGLLRVAEAQRIPSGARKNAVFWLAQAAGDRATEGLTSIVGDDSDEIEVRKQAVFALSQMRTDATVDALIDIARTNREPELRKSAIFWLGQSGSPRAITFFEEVLRG
jgi:hypothetical protein